MRAEFYFAAANGKKGGRTGGRAADRLMPDKVRPRSHRRLLPVPPVTAPGERYNSVRQLGVMDSLRCSIMRRAASRVLSSSARSSSRQ